MIIVSNRRSGRQKGAIYAGRPGPFGNPFRLYTENDRAAVLKLFQDWFLGDSGGARRMRELALKLPQDAVLECWCVPKACHAEVIAEWVNRSRKEGV